ncbi:class II aldolase/adducin, N-terminal [Hyaloraphidium curvatum]|nr:class II aldolase/adducin, N-terminal [Hyaloraphidium curvatum]
MPPSGSSEAAHANGSDKAAEDNLVYKAQTPSPAEYIAFGSRETDATGHVTAVPEFIPRPPTFPSLLEVRKDRLNKLAAGFRVFGKQGWGFGNNGHISVRDPIKDGCFWMNPYGVPFSKMKVSDLVLVNGEGDVIYGRYPTVNPAGWAIHHSLHLARSNVISAAHAHTPDGTAFSAFGIPLIPYAQDSAAIYERHVVFDGMPLIGDTVEAGKMAALLGEKNVVILARNHGLFTVGETVEEALWWFILTERVCAYQLRIMSASAKQAPVPVPHDIAVKSRDGGLAGPLAGYFGFVPHYAEIVAEQPDLLE